MRFLDAACLSMTNARYALTVDVIRLKGIREVYSFDEGFDRIEGVAKLPTL
jgi:hypothetical protein